MSCDLDPVNMCCWTHGTDIKMEDYLEDCCSRGDVEDYDDDEPPYTDDDAASDIENEIMRKASE